MAITSTREIVLGYTGDLEDTQRINAASNGASPGSRDIVTLASGANTVTVPTGGTTPVACTIVPPVGNTQSLTLKGVTGDTGVALHKTDPTTIALDPSQTTFVLTAGATITGVKLLWS